MPFAQSLWENNNFLDFILHPNFKRLNSRNLNQQASGSCDRASWAKCEERGKTNKMQQLDVYY